MLFNYLLFILAYCFCTVASVFVDEAYSVDWHLERIGHVNTVESSSDLAVLAGEVFITAVNTTTGKVNWRKPVDPGTKYPTIAKTTSAAGVDSFVVCNGLNVFSFDPSGFSQWQLRLPEGVSAKAVTSFGGALLVARSDDTISKVESLFGTINWTKRVEDASKAVGSLPSGFVLQDASTGTLKTVFFEEKVPKETVLSKKSSKFLDSFGSHVVWEDSKGTIFIDHEATGFTNRSPLYVDHSTYSIAQNIDGDLQRKFWGGKSTYATDIPQNFAVNTRVFSLNGGSLLNIVGNGQAYQTIELYNGKVLEWSKKDIAVDNVLFLDKEDLAVEAELLFEENASVIGGFVDRIKRHVLAIPDALTTLSRSLLTFKTFTTTSSDRLAHFFYKIIVFVNEQDQSFYAFDNKGELLWMIDHLTDEGPFFVGSNNKVIGKTHSIDFEGHVEEILSTASDANGYTVDFDSEHVFGVDQSIPTWTYSLPGYKVISIARRDSDDVSVSIGNIRPDRTVQYKYLHPATVAAVMLNEDTNSLRVVLLDIVTGKVLHVKEHSNVAVASGGIHLAFGEYWIVYSYVSSNGGGPQLALWTLYESEIPNEKTLSSLQNYSSFAKFPQPVVVAKSVFIPSIVSGLSVSKTRFGITTRDIIVSFVNGEILALPPAVLESSEVTALSIDGNAVISHERQVFVENFRTTGCLFESTSLVVGYKPDVFFTRITPSQPFDMLTPSFSKTSLVNTVVILLVLIGLLRGPVNRRALDARWS